MVLPKGFALVNDWYQALDTTRSTLYEAAEKELFVSVDRWGRFMDGL